MATLECSQCGRPAPADRAELGRWGQGGLAVAGGVDDVTASMLLCPDCVDDDREREYEEGEPG
jgi:hypothetical protein